MGKTEEIRSRYILSALEDHCLNGDAYGFIKRADYS